MSNDNTVPTNEEIRETIQSVQYQHDLETAIAFAKLEVFELEHGKRDVAHCPGIQKLAEISAIKKWAFKLSDA